MRRLAVTPPQTDDWLHWWVKTYLGVSIPRVRVCEHHHAPFEAFAHSYFARSPIVIWEASRGFGGKSMLLATLGLTELITLGTNIRILGGSGEQAQRINAYLRNEDPNIRGQLWEAPQAPKHLLAGTTKTEVRLSNGGYVKALMASSTSVRGPHPVRLRVDECDELSEDLYNAAMGQTMANHGVKANTTLSSTHHYPDRVMTLLKEKAQDPDSGHALFSWCFRESERPHGWLDPAEVERKRKEVPASVFANEYMLQEPNPEGRVFTKEVLDDLFDRALGSFPDEKPGREVRVVEPGVVPGRFDRKGRPVRREFYHGVDWAKRQDMTVVHSVMKSSTGPDILAAWARYNRMPWPVMISHFNNRVEEYGGTAVHDSTGVGDVCGDYLTVESDGFDFNRRKERAEMFSSYVAAVEAGEYAYPMIPYLHREHKFLSLDDLYFGGHPPDSVVAAALAQRARESDMFTLRIGSL